MIVHYSEQPGGRRPTWSLVRPALQSGDFGNGFRECVTFSVGPGVPPAAERLLQVESHSQGQVVLVLPSHNLHAQGQALLVQAQGTLSDGQPQDVDDA